MVNWEDIHPDFAKKEESKTYQQLWEEAGFIYQEAQEWIRLCFEPENYDEVNQWKILNFTPQEAKSWREVGLIEWDDAQFAAYLRYKGYRPNPSLELEQLKEEFKTWLNKSKFAQEYLDCFYPPEQRSVIKILHIDKENLTNTLNLNDFPNLKELYCFNNQLISLKLDNCLELKKLNCSFNNFLQDLSIFNNLANLELLWIENNPFYGSLESLKGLNKLERLNIGNTDIDSGLEYLPDSLKGFSCSVDERKNTKVKQLEEELKKHKKFYEREMPDNIILLKRWKKANKKLIEGANTSLLIINEQLNAKEKQIQELRAKIAANLTNQIEIEKIQAEKTNLEQELKVLKAKYSELLNKELTNSLEIKEKDLEKLKSKFNKEQFVMEDLLEAEDYLASCDISSDHHYHQTTKEKSVKRLKERNFKEKDISKLCEIQQEITQLKLDLEDLKPQAKLALEEGTKETKLLEYPIFSQELMVKMSDFLTAKQTFLNARKETIEELKKCCNKLEIFIEGKHAIFLEIGNTFSNVGGATDVTAFVIPKAVGEAIKTISNLSKIKISQKSSQEFQLFLGNEESELIQLNAAYSTLLNLIKSNQEASLVITNEFNLKDKLENKEVKLFDSKYKVFEVVIGEGIWEGRPLNPERMEKVIVSLSENLESLKSELEKETKQFKEISSQAGQVQQTLIAQSTNFFGSSK